MTILACLNFKKKATDMGVRLVGSVLNVDDHHNQILLYGITYAIIYSKIMN